MNTSKFKIMVHLKLGIIRTFSFFQLGTILFSWADPVKSSFLLHREGISIVPVLTFLMKFTTQQYRYVVMV